MKRRSSCDGYKKKMTIHYFALVKLSKGLYVLIDSEMIEGKIRHDGLSDVDLDTFIL
jgi:hypothetical protein